MDEYSVYVPKAKAEPIQSITIVDLIPVGRDNAVPRNVLVAKCVSYGLVKEGKNKDRKTRDLINRARRDYTILNLSNGVSYYRPSIEDLQDLQRYIRQEEKRGKATFKNIKTAKALYADYLHGRLGE